MTKDHAQRNAKDAAPAAEPDGERASLPGERAEGEGMLAPASQKRGPKDPAHAVPASKVEGEGSVAAARA